MVAEVDNRIAGFVTVVAATRGDAPDDPAVHAWVHDVFVRSEHRRRGIGTALMRAAEAFAHGRGATELRLAVLARNVAAHALYRRLNFRDYVRVLAKPLGAQASGAGSSVAPIR